jgi:hypothetical protein
VRRNIFYQQPAGQFWPAQNKRIERYHVNYFSDFLLQRLSERNVKRIFGYPGDGINGFMGALDRQDAIRLRTFSTQGAKQPRY